MLAGLCLGWGRAGICALAAVVVLGAAAPAGALAKETYEADFLSLCVATGAKVEAVEAAARKAGFRPVANVPAPEGSTKAVGFERDVGRIRQVVVGALGQTDVLKGRPERVGARSCALTVIDPTWDVSAFAKRWTGVAPLAEEGGIALFSYQEAAGGNVSRDTDDFPEFLKALNAGQMRTVAAVARDDSRSVSWVVLEAPDPPMAAPEQAAKAAAAPVLPPAPLPAHDVDPFSPCSWKADEKGVRQLFCPGPDKRPGARPEPVKVTEATVAEARGGDTNAMLRLAAFYVSGPQSARDPGAALAWFRKAADAQDARGAFNLGLAFDSGLGMPSDLAQAATWYEAAAAKEHAPAMINFARLQLSGKGVPKNPAAAMALVRRAAEAGSTDAMFNMGILNHAGQGGAPDYAEALRWYRMAAERGDGGAKYAMGLLHLGGLGIPKNEGEAIRLFVESRKSTIGLITTIVSIEAMMMNVNDPRQRSRIAAGDGREAQVLGFYLSDKRGSAYRPREAAPLLQMAAEKGWAASATRLGMMYADGEGVPRDQALALHWLRIGGHQEGRYRHITRYEDGELQ